MPVDPLDALQPGDIPREPRPEFRAELRQRLVAAVRGDTDHDTNTDTGGPVTPSWLYYFTLPTRDVDRAERFYTELFGWQMVRNERGDGFHVEGVQPPMGVGTNDRDVAQLWFVVDDIDAAVATVRANGGTADEPVHYESGGAADCRDDQGTEFSLSVPAYETTPVGSTKPGELFYFSMPVADGVRARSFFGSVFGWTFDGAGDQGGVHVANSKPDGGIGVGRAGHAPELWFRVAQLEQAMARVVQLGGTAQPAGDGPEGRHAACTDDQGIFFGISEPAEGN